jgi:Cu/Zn superoxide dismutase
MPTPAKEDHVRKLIPLLVAGAVAALAIAAVSSARSSVAVTAKLSAAQEIPKQTVKNTKAHGAFTATLTGRKLKWKLTFAGLTGAATAAHIHAGAMGKAGPVIVALCGPCKSGASGTATISAAVLNKIDKHLAYVNVHTAKNPAGEIRGQVAAGM